MSNQSQTPFTDKFFQVSRRVTYFVLGKDQQDIFENFRDLDLDSDDSYRLFIATGIDPAKNRCIGVFDEPTVVCGQLFQKTNRCRVPRTRTGKPLCPVLGG